MTHHDNDFPATEFANQLVTWYHANARRLPWRETTDPYAIWLSEVMLQQTRVETVIPYYQRFLDRFPTLVSLANASEQEVLKAWEGLGYYRRIRLLQQGARQVIQQHGGELPGDPRTLAAIPGIGPYMTGSLASIAFNLPVPAVDGNVIRVATRVLAWPEDPGTAASKRLITAWVRQLFPGQAARDLTQALMELGALICLPQHPQCHCCPVQSFCKAVKTDPEIYPVKKPAREIPVERRVILRIAWNGRRLLIKRPPGGLMAGFWEYPNLLAQPDDDPLKLADTWSQNNLGQSLAFTPVKKTYHIFTHLRWNLEIYHADWRVKSLPPSRSEWQWLEPDEERKLPRLAFIRKLESEK